ncbi:tripartite motif-containing protein 44 isoform 1-T1 [Discoglossus pictus]
MACAPGEIAQLPPDGTCDACEPDEAKEAEEICDDCGFSFCGPHAEEHRVRFTEHRVRDVSEPPPTQLDTTTEEPKTEEKKDEKKKCLVHNQELTLYCREDEKIICVLCAVTGDHRQHQLITLNEAYQGMKNRKPVDLKLAMTEMVERLKSKCADPRVSRGEIKGFVQKEFDHMRQLVQEEEHRALHYVDLQEAVASAHVTEVLAELNVHMGKLMTEMAEITRQLNSFNQIAMQKDEDQEDNSSQDRSPSRSPAAGSSRSHLKNPPRGNGPW